MSLEQNGTYNRLTPEMRQMLETKVRAFGKVVRYKFKIEQENPDPEKYGGIKKVFPATYTLDPCTFSITDLNEKRTGESRGKKIGLVDSTDKDGKPDRFLKIRLYAKDKGVLSLNIEQEEDFQKAMYLEMHPKQENGLFKDDKLFLVFSRIDESAYATEQRNARQVKLKALNAVASMSDSDLAKFADAMNWGSGQEPDILRNEIEALAENAPDMFNDLIEGDKVEYQSVVKRAMDNKIISFDPGEYKYIWTSNSHPITTLSPNGDKNEIEKLAEWLQTGGDKAKTIFEKMKGLLQPAK